MAITTHIYCPPVGRSVNETRVKPSILIKGLDIQVNSCWAKNPKKIATLRIRDGYYFERLTNWDFLVLKGTTAPDTFADKMGNFFFQKRPISVCGGILKVYTKHVGTIFSFLANCEVSISSKKNGNSSRKYFFESMSISIVHAYIKY